MSNIATDFATFDVLDYKNESPTTKDEAVLSSYNLSITPLTFKAKIPSETPFKADTFDLSRATFNFGDGTIITGTTATHVYQYPGRYNVKVALRDNNNNAIFASASADVDVYDYIVNTFSIEFPGESSGADGGGKYGKGRLSNLNLSAGEFSDPLSAYIQTPLYQDFQDLNFALSGCDYDNYFNLEPNKFNHLKNYYSFYKKNPLPAMSGSEYVEIQKISLSAENMYVRLSSFGTDLSAKKIIPSNSVHPGSILVGSSGQENIYFKTEEQTAPIYLSFSKDSNNINSRTKDQIEKTNFSTNFSITLSTFVGSTSGQTLSNIEITSTGLGGEGDGVNSFPLSPVQYKGVGIPFVLAPKNSDSYAVKALSAGNPYFKVLSSNHSLTHPLCVVPSQYYTISSISHLVSTFGTDFWYRGLFTFNDSISTYPTILTLSASNDYSFGSTITGLTGAAFLSCFPRNYYDLYKHNEDFDFEQTIKDLRFQEILIDKNIFFTDFIGSIFGGVSSSHALLGKTLYEKIFNFVQNNDDIDFCDVNSLVNLSNMVNQDGLVFNRTNFQDPAQIKRTVDLLSTSYNKFRGTKNKFNENFASRGHIDKETYGKNISSAEINTYTYVVSAETPIVAKEKFSGIYAKLNTYQPLSAATLRDGSTTQYSLSEIGSESPRGSAWGWPLTLPGEYDIGTVNRFYSFHEYNSHIEGTIVDGIIDFVNPQTRLSFNTPLSSLEGNNNIFDRIITDTLFSSLSLFE
tara:strand:+ start:2488 stop:4719 length:2232 start_codon:yes stop_codon:yes gene_type:complete